MNTDSIYVLYAVTTHIRQYGIVVFPTLYQALVWTMAEQEYVGGAEILAFQDVPPSFLWVVTQREKLAAELSDSGAFEIERETLKRLMPNAEFMAELALVRLGRFNKNTYENSHMYYVLADMFYDAMTLTELHALESVSDRLDTIIKAK